MHDRCENGGIVQEIGAIDLQPPAVPVVPWDIGRPPPQVRPTTRKDTAMSLDSYITLGRSGLRVSPFCLGTMTFGEDLGWGASPEDSEAMIAAYLDRGGNFIDTANVYTNGHSEKIIGDFFTQSDARRDRVV